MNQRPRSTEPTSGDASGGRPRGQSDVLAIVLLLGMVFLGAAAVVVSGGFLVDSVQDDSKHQVAESTADQTHQLISEAATSGEARQLPTIDGNAVSSEVTSGGSITLAMSFGGTQCDAVQADLGAIEYDSGDQAVIYEGGAIWERSDAGYSIRRAPGIDYAGDNAQLSLTVIGGTTTNDQGERVVTPNATLSRQVNQDLSEMILDCRLANRDQRGDLNVSVDSEHADAWERYFEESVAAGNGDVHVTPVDDTTVNLTIENLTDRIDEEWLIVHEWERNGNNARIENGVEGLDLNARVRNTGPVATNGTVQLQIEGNTYDTYPIDSLASNQLERVDLEADASQLAASLTPGEVYNYSITIDNGSESWNMGSNSTVSSRFYFGQPQPEFIVTDVYTGINGSLRMIGGTVDNIGVDNDTQPVTLSLTHLADNTSVPVDGNTIQRTLVRDQRGDVVWGLNRSTLAGGEYRFTITTEDDSMTGTFTVGGLAGNGTEVSTGTAGTATVTVLGTEVSAETLQSVHVPNSERDDATLERTDRGMFMPTVVAEDQDSGYGTDWAPREQPGGGWVPAERVGGTLQPMNVDASCSGDPTDYYTSTTGDDWHGWQVDDCWNSPDGFLWSDSGGYDFEWALARSTTYGGGWWPDEVSREDTTWSFDGDADMDYEKRWSHVSAEAVVERDGSVAERHDSWEPSHARHDGNLNTYDTQEQEWTQEIEAQRGDSFTIATTLRSCADYDDEGTRYDEHGYEWTDLNCEDGGRVTNDVDASQDPNDPGIRFLGDGDVIPEVRAGYPDQRSADEVLNVGAEHRIDETTGELDLGPREFVFIVELTDTDPEWHEAHTQESYGDPNYNDVIGLFEYEPHITEVTVESQGTPDDSPGWSDDVDDSGSSDDETGGAGSNIETDVTHVVIG